MGPREIIVIALVVVLLFGAPRLPQLARAIGKSMRILKDETKSLADDSVAPDDGDSETTGAGTVDQPRKSNDSPVVPESTIDASAVDKERRDKR